MIKKLKYSLLICLFLAGPLFYVLALIADLTIGDGDGIVFYRKLWLILGTVQIIGIVSGLILILDKRGKRRMGQTFIGILVAIGVSEVALRYNNKLANAISDQDNFVLDDTIQIRNNPKVHDSVVISKYNKIGFHGPELYDCPEDYKKLFFVGNSVTACGYLNTGEDWPLKILRKAIRDTAKLWMNNASFVGHSSHGNLVLLDKYLVKYKPDYLVLMTGYTDENNGEPNYFDAKTFNDLRTNKGLDKISKYSYLVKLYQYLKSHLSKINFKE